MATPARTNAHKLWTPEESALLRHLAQAGVPTSQIAERLGRSMGAVSKQAEKLRISVSEKRATRSLSRRWEVYSPDEEPPRN
jgi:hypothetical protein